MRVLGVLALVLGVLGLVVALQMDTTVAGASVLHRVHNIGLMDRRQSLLMVFGLLALVGALFFALGGRGAAAGAAPADDQAGRVPCQHCAEQILPAALVCRFCGRDVAAAPALDEPAQMAELGVTRDGAMYRFGDYRYERLQDALDYARMQAGAGRSAG